MGISENFILAAKHISKKETVPYYIESKLNDLSVILEYNDIAELLYFILSNDRAGDVFRYFNRTKILKNIFYPARNLVFVPQKKGRAKNAFEHTMNVIESVPIDNISLRYSALFHDLGKYKSHMQDGHFRNHQIYSYEIAKEFCALYSIPNSEKILVVVKNHMFPLDYQRMPNWTTAAINTFIERCGVEHALDVVEFSYYDKKAENNVPEFLQIIEDLRDKVKARIDEAYN